MTLLELMVSVTLFVGGLLALTQVNLIVSDVERIDETRRVVSRVVGEQLRRIENTPFVDIPSVHDGEAFDVVAADADQSLLTVPDGDADGLPGSIHVELLDEYGTGTHVLRVTVRVDWVERGEARSYERIVFLSRYGAVR